MVWLCPIVGIVPWYFVAKTNFDAPDVWSLYWVTFLSPVFFLLWLFQLRPKPTETVAPSSILRVTRLYRIARNMILGAFIMLCGAGIGMIAHALNFAYRPNRNSPLNAAIDFILSMAEYIWIAPIAVLFALWILRWVKFHPAAPLIERKNWKSRALLAPAVLYAIPLCFYGVVITGLAIVIIGAFGTMLGFWGNRAVVVVNK